MLRELEFINCDGRKQNREVISTRPTSDVVSLRWVGALLEDLDFLRRFPRLQKLEITEASDLRDLSGILSIPDGCQVELAGVPDDVDESPIDELRDAGRCFVDYRPQLTWKYEPDSGGS
jgi:hypothetical protein